MNNNYNDPVTPPSPAVNDTPSPTYDSQPASTPAPAQNTGFKDNLTGLNLTEKDLADKEAALRRREEMIANRERQVDQARANGTLSSLNQHPRNFPILLKFYKYYPEEDLPSDALPLMKKMMLSTYANLIVLFINVIGAFFCLAPGPKQKLDSSATTIVFSIVYLLVGYPLSLELGLFVFYNALKQGKALKYIGAMVFTAIYFCFIVYLAVGLGDYGSVGWITTINVFGAAQNSWVGIITVIYSILATAYACLLAFIFYLAYKYYKSTDLQSRAVGEAAGMAAQYASDHREEIIDAARNNPELAVQAAQMASSGMTYT